MKRTSAMLGLALILVGGIALYSIEQIDSLAASAAVPFAPLVLIDAGHGGFDGGATGADGTIEKDINLAIAQKLDGLASLCGFETIMVRSTDCSVEQPGLTGLRKRKVSDIHQRLALTNQHPQALFVSIHQNHFPQEKQWGTQVFYGSKNQSSRLLAERIQQNVVESLQPENRRAVKAAQDNLYVLTRAENTAVMVECGFLSNGAECKQLCTPEYQQQLAFVIVRSMLEQRQQHDEGMVT